VVILSKLPVVVVKPRVAAAATKLAFKSLMDISYHS